MIWGALVGGLVGTVVLTTLLRAARDAVLVAVPGASSGVRCACVEDAGALVAKLLGPIDVWVNYAMPSIERSAP
jgi:hypothetical protein